MTKFTDEGAASAERRPGGRPFNFAHSYAVVLAARGGDLHRLGLGHRRVGHLDSPHSPAGNRLVRAPNLARATRVRLVANIVLVLAAIVAVVSFFVNNPGDQLGVISAVCCLLYLIAPFSIVRHLVFRPKVDTETLLGAVAAYLLIGMFFAFAYKAAGEFGSMPFFGADGKGSLSQDLFFSFVTMTTVGYGNLVPAANPGQTFAVLEAVIGQLFLVVAVGKIISNVTLRRRDQSGS